MNHSPNFTHEYAAYCIFVLRTRYFVNTSLKNSDRCISGYYRMSKIKYEDMKQARDRVISGTIRDIFNNKYDTTYIVGST